MYSEIGQLSQVVEYTTGQRLQSSVTNLKLLMSICTRRKKERRGYIKLAECSQLRDLIGQDSQTLVLASLRRQSNRVIAT